MEEKRIYMKDEDSAELIRSEKLCFRIGQTMPFTKEYDKLIRELFCGKIGEGSSVHAPFHCTQGNRVEIGRNSIIMYNVDIMSAGGVIIDDDVMVAAGTKIVTNNHDFDDHRLLLVKPVHLCSGCWIGAGSIILPGVTVGEGAVIGAGAVVTRDIPAGTVAAGCPARIIREL